MDLKNRPYRYIEYVMAKRNKSQIHINEGYENSKEGQREERNGSSTILPSRNGNLSEAK